MSVLNIDPGTPPNPADLIAEGFRQHARSIYQQLISSFNGGSKEFWRNTQGVSPEEIAAALGTDAVEIFQLHHKIGTLLAEINPAVIAEGLSVVGEFTYNEDGSLTIVSTPEEIPELMPEPTPEDM